MARLAQSLSEPESQMPVTAPRFCELLGFEDRGVTLLSREVQPSGDYTIEHLRLRIGE